MIICLFCKKHLKEILIELCPNCPLSRKSSEKLSFSWMNVIKLIVTYKGHMKASINPNYVG